MREDFPMDLRSFLGLLIHILLLNIEQSCLAMRYEALNLRELNSSSCLWLRVSHSEWTNFAFQSMENGFPSIAEKVIYSSFSKYIS